MGTAHETAGGANTATERLLLRSAVFARLQHGPAAVGILARWCGVPLYVMREVVGDLRARCAIVDYGEDLALPYTPARPIKIPQFRWGSTRLG
jgi:hypothetical protein